MPAGALFTALGAESELWKRKENCFIQRRTQRIFIYGCMEVYMW